MEEAIAFAVSLHSRKYQIQLCIGSAIAALAEPTDLGSLAQNLVKSNSDAIRSLSGGFFGRLTAADFWLVFEAALTLIGCMLVGCSGDSGYLRTDTGIENRNMEGGVVGKGGLYTEGGTAGSSGLYTEGGTANGGEREPIPASDQTECCSVHAAGGCADIVVQTCVCEVDPKCCEESWDTVCVQWVSLLGCGTCAQPTKDCCTASLASGCGDPSIQACVCAVDPKCCNQVWDEFCVLLVDELGCGTCD